MNHSVSNRMAAPNIASGASLSGSRVSALESERAALNRADAVPCAPRVRVNGRPFMSSHVNATMCWAAVGVISAYLAYPYLPSARLMFAGLAGGAGAGLSRLRPQLPRIRQICAQIQWCIDSWQLMQRVKAYTLDVIECGLTEANKINKEAIKREMDRLWNQSEVADALPRQLRTYGATLINYTEVLLRELEDDKRSQDPTYKTVYDRFEEPIRIIVTVLIREVIDGYIERPS